jgi:DNA-binding NtrC family response regulator
MNTFIGKVLAVTPDYHFTQDITAVCQLDGHAAAGAYSATEALHTLQEFVPDVIVYDKSTEDIDLFTFIEAARAIHPAAMFVIMARRLEIAQSRLLMQMGVRNHLIAPFEAEDLLAEIASCIYYLNGWNRLQAR